MSLMSLVMTVQVSGSETLVVTSGPRTGEGFDTQMSVLMNIQIVSLSEGLSTVGPIARVFGVSTAMSGEVVCVNSGVLTSGRKSK